MEFIKTLLEQQPLMALFLTIAIGYLVGEINIKGFSLGVGAVLFVALGMGWFAPKSVPAPMVGTLGLALFLYGVGVQYGKQFFIGLTSRAGLKANAMALTGVLCGRRREPHLREADEPQARLRARLVRRLGHEHAHAASRDRDARQRRSRRRLFGRVSLRRGRADPVPLRRLHGAEAEDRNAHRRRHGASRNRRAQSRAVRQIARRADERAARRRADRRPAPRGPQRAGVAQFRHRRKRRRPRRRVRRRKRSRKPARSSAKPRPATSSKTARDLDYLRVFASRPALFGKTLERTRPARRESGRHHPGPPRRRRHPAAPRPRDRVRRPHRRARPSRRFRGDAQILRRLDQDDRRVQLHLHRHRHGARLPASARSSSRCRPSAKSRSACPACSSWRSSSANSAARAA